LICTPSGNVFEIVKTLIPSGRGELEITDVNNAYIVREELTYDVLDGWWTDAGTHASLAKANELAQELYFGEDFGKLKLNVGSFISGKDLNNLGPYKTPLVIRRPITKPIIVAKSASLFMQLIRIRESDIKCKLEVKKSWI